MEAIFQHHSSTLAATQAVIEKLAAQFDEEGKITGYTFSSIVSEMGALNDAVRNACALPFTKMQEIYSNKLATDGFSKETAHSIALMMTATIEGGILLCLTHKTSDPLRTISQVLPNLLKGS
ncbi:putative HTH-type transcriptional regulator YxaF [compost metagenome]